MDGALISYHSFLRKGSTAFFLPPFLDLRCVVREWRAVLSVSLYVLFVVGSLRAAAASRGGGRRRAGGGRAAPRRGPGPLGRAAGARRATHASPGVQAFPELLLLLATPRRLAVSTARRRAARFGAQLQSSLSTSDAATHLVNRLFLPIAMAAASFRARERQRSGAGAT